MILIIGLGNPGKEYEKTRHNAGFLALDYLASKMNEKWSKTDKARAEVIETNIDGNKVVLAKPMTFMNLSGEAVAKLVSKYKVTPENVWVVYDDVDLDLGTVRVRTGGSSGGHNGMKSIIGVIGKEFSRIRIGIDETPEKRRLEDWVLSKFTADEMKELEQMSEIVRDIIFEGIKTGKLESLTEK